MKPKALLQYLVLLFLLCHGLLWPLELKKGKIKLILHEGIGRFSMYVLSHVRDQEYVPLFVAQDPRTSGITLVVDNKVIKLGESSQYKEEIQKTAGGASFVWTSNMLEVTQAFKFVTSSQSILPDGLKITLTLTNISRRSLEAGLRMFLDTYLGEDGAHHFRTDRHTEINRELSISRDNMIQYWISPSSREPDIGLQCMTSGQDITLPDRIVFANWKRLHDTTWRYETSSSRSFNLVPYSINDSAACHYYNPTLIGSGASRKIVVILGNFKPGGFIVSSREKVQPELDNLLQEAAEKAESIESEEPSISPAAALNLINELIDQLTKKLSSGEKITDEEMKLMQEMLNELKLRSNQYSESR
ncbi:hypothetical protein ES703_47405 [subsurface metagenome]